MGKNERKGKYVFKKLKEKNSQKDKKIKIKCKNKKKKTYYNEK
jgi:hypothetical protein